MNIEFVKWDLFVFVYLKLQYSSPFPFLSAMGIIICTLQNSELFLWILEETGTHVKMMMLNVFL